MIELDWICDVSGYGFLFVEDWDWCEEMNGGGREAEEPMEWMFSQVFGEMSAGDEVQEG